MTKAQKISLTGLIVVWSMYGAFQFAKPEFGAIATHLKGRHARYKDVEIEVPLHASYSVDNNGLFVYSSKGWLRSKLSGRSLGMTEIYSSPYLEQPLTPDGVEKIEEKWGAKAVGKNSMRFADRSYDCLEYEAHPFKNGQGFSGINIWCVTNDVDAPLATFRGTRDKVPEFYDLLLSAKRIPPPAKRTLLATPETARSTS